MPSPAVSVIIPTYNRRVWVLRALQSVMDQIRPDDEVLVADDGSTDETGQAIEALYGGRIRYYRLPHGGAGIARNRAIQLTTRPLVAFLDSDDEWMPGKLALQRALMERCPEVIFCFSDFAVREQSGTEAHHFLVRWRDDPRPWSEILGPGIPYSTLADLPAGAADFPVHVGSLYLAEMEQNHVLTSSAMVRREPAGEALRFAEDLRVSEDKECFARLAAVGPAAYLDTETVWQSGHRGPRLTDAGSIELASARLTLLHRIWEQDAAFVERFGTRLQRAIRLQHLLRARCYLARGMMQQARYDLAQVPDCPLTYRLLGVLPGVIMRGGLALRRWIRNQRATAD